MTDFDERRVGDGGGDLVEEDGAAAVFPASSESKDQLYALKSLLIMPNLQRKHDNDVSDIAEPANHGVALVHLLLDRLVVRRGRLLGLERLLGSGERSAREGREEGVVCRGGGDGCCCLGGELMRMLEVSKRVGRNESDTRDVPSPSVVGVARPP